MSEIVIEPNKKQCHLCGAGLVCEKVSICRIKGQGVIVKLDLFCSDCG
jgi:hypothetical protein